MFVSSKRGMSRSHFAYLESKLISLGRASPHVEVRNKNFPNPPALSLPDERAVELYLESLVKCLKFLLGLNFGDHAADTLFNSGTYSGLSHGLGASADDGPVYMDQWEVLPRLSATLRLKASEVVQYIDDPYTWVIVTDQGTFSTNFIDRWNKFRDACLEGIGHSIPESVRPIWPQVQDAIIKVATVYDMRDERGTPRAQAERWLAGYMALHPPPDALVPRGTKLAPSMEDSRIYVDPLHFEDWFRLYRSRRPNRDNFAKDHQRLKWREIRLPLTVDGEPQPVKCRRSPRNWLPPRPFR